MPRFRKLVDDGLDLLSQASGSDMETMLKTQINATYHQCLEAIRQDTQRREFSLTTVASTAAYGMPLYVREVLNIEDPDNNRSLYDIAARQFDTRFPGDTTSGTPLRAYPVGVVGVQRQPASTGLLTLLSSSTADSGSSYTVQVTGFASGVLVTESVQMSGTTAVTTTNTYDTTNGVQRVVKTPATGYTFAGSVTVKDDDANTLAVIPTWWDSPSYLWYEFHPIPSSAITYTVRAVMRKPDLVNDNDWPELPDEYHDLLLHGPVAALLPHVGKQGAANTHSAIFSRRYAEFTRQQGRRPARVRTFANVQAQINPNRPGRPLIPNVDI